MTDRRRALYLFALLWGGLCLGVFNLAVGVQYLSQYRFRNDFRLDFAAARVALSRGWPHLYDYAAQRAAIADLGPGFNWQPFVSPPPLAAVALPFTILPFPTALAVWTAGLVAALLGAWWLAAPGGRLQRATHLALLLGFFPAVFGLAIGQSGALIALGVAASWRLLRSEHPLWAGLVLGALALKPQIGVLVPVALLFALRLRTLGALAAITALVGAASLLALGAEGIRGWLAALADASTWIPTRRFTAADLLGTGWLFTAFQLITVALVAAAGRRHRHGDPGLVLAAGLVASSLFTPYLGFQDFVVLVAAGWLALRGRPPAWHVALLLAGYLVLFSALTLGTLPVVLWRLAWLASLLALPAAPATRSGLVWTPPVEPA